MEKVEKITTSERRSGGRGIAVLIVVALLVLVGLWWTGILPGASMGFGGDDYQAVFLTNGQVYFGKLAKVHSRYPVLRDIFYLQVTQGLQPIDESAGSQQNVNLVKLGAELHGPTDTMILNRDHILFYENLKDDSQVVQAISDFKANNP